MPDADPPLSQPRRTLAAIVVTDVAGFSGLTEKDEDRTLGLVKRDLAAISAACEKFHGRVLKSTGDGLLMTFDSAVQAVACALEVQRAMRDNAKKLPPEQVLRHRIGIHLGDVFFSESDVMGDGVNVAARLQGQADPGGICISQTVYDVVKNRLAITATYLGPRELKNIQEAVPVYQIILDAAKGPAAARRKPLSRNAWLVIGAGGFAGLAVLLVLTFLIYRAVSGSTGGTGDLAGTATTTTAASPATLSQDAIIEEGRNRFLNGYDFKGMVQFLEGKGLKDTPIYGRYKRLDKLKLLAKVELRNTSADKPIVVVMEHGGKQVQVWMNDASRIVVKGPEGEQQEMGFDDLEPAVMVGLMQAVMKRMSAGPELRQGITDLADELQVGGSPGRRGGMRP